MSRKSVRSNKVHCHNRNSILISGFKVYVRMPSKILISLRPINGISVCEIFAELECKILE